MIRRRALSALVAACLVALTTAAAQPADDVLKLIPSDALGFAVVNRPAETDGKIQALGRQMQLPVPSLLNMVKSGAGIKEGLDEKATAAVAVMPPEEGSSEPVALLFFPVTDFAKFIEPMGPDDPSARIVKVRVFGDAALAAKVGRYAVLVEPKNRQTLENALAPEKSVADEVAPLRPWLAENDVAGVMTSHGVKLVCQLARKGLQEARAGVEAMGKDVEPALAMLGLYEKLFAACEEEVEAVALGAHLDEQSVLRVTSRTRFAAGGQVAKCIGQVQPTKADLLAGLPSGPFVVAFGAAMPEGSAEGLIQFSAGVMKAMRGFYGLSDEQVDKLMEQSREYMEAMRSISMVLGVGDPGDPLYGNMLFVMSVDDARAFLTVYEKQIESMSELMKDAAGPVSWTMESEKVEVGGLPALKVEMEIRAPGAEDIPDFTAIMEKMFGPGGKMTFYTAAADEHTVVDAYTTQKSLMRGIEAVKERAKSLAADKSVARTAALLPSQAPFVGYWSPAGTIDLINRAMSLFGPGPQFGFQLPKFPDSPPIGFAVTGAPNELQTHMVVPAEVLKAIGQYVIKVRQGIEIMR